jgi:hypothetical protein
MVPLIAQQARPPFFPLFTPSARVSTAAGQMPISATLLPPGSLPQFLNSQQFCFVMNSSLSFDQGAGIIRHISSMQFPALLPVVVMGPGKHFTFPPAITQQQICLAKTIGLSF